MELSMEKTKITDVREGFDFLGYRIAQRQMPSTGRHVGLLFIPKSKSQLVWPKNWNGGITCTSRVDRACRSARIGARGSKAASATSSISRSQRAESQNQSSGIEPWACDHAAS